MKIEVEFTDAQWALIQAHYPNYVENEAGVLVHQDITAELLKDKLFDNIKLEVSECVMNTARKEAAQQLENCFDV